VLAGQALPGPTPPNAAATELARAVEADGRRPQVRLDDGDPAGVVVAVPHRTGSLAAAAGVLALHSLEVHAAELATLGGVAVFTFTVSPRFGGLPDPALLRSDLIRVLDGGLHLPDALARKERDYAPLGTAVEPAAPPRALWFDDEATGAVVLELRGTDRIGLLHRIAAALEECGADVRWARASTLGASVVDAFGLAGTGGDGTLGRTERRRIEKAVLAAAR
jgi:[protein-PII] uridylyltransferase